MFDKVKNFNLFNIGGKLSLVAQAQNTILSAASILAFSSGMTAILGLVKGRLLTSYFGVSDELGVFYTADKIPNLIYSILVLGALSTIFIPIFSELIEKDKEHAWRAASSIIISTTLIFLFISIGVIVFAEPIMRIVSIGKFTEDQIYLGANLMRLMMVGQLILVISSFITSILQSFRLFLFPALAPILYNLGMLIGIAFLHTPLGIYAPAAGVIIGALGHLIIQLPSLKETDFKFEAILDLKDKSVLKMYTLVPPRVLSVLLSQLLLTISTSLAILISTSSVVILKFGSQLQYFPVSLFGASMAAAALPVLSKHTGFQNHEKFKTIFLTTLHQMMFLVVPASVILLILRVPIVRLVYGVSNFTWADTVQTSYTLGFFSISIFAQSMIYLINRSFYSLKDTVTPVKVALVTTILNIGISFIFVHYLKLGVWSLAFAFSITSILDAFFLLILLSKKLGGFDQKQLFVPLIKIGYASFFMGISLYLPLKVLDQFVFDTTKTINLMLLTAIAGGAGTCAYLLFTHLFKVEEIELLYKLLRRLNIGKIKASYPTEVISQRHE